MKTLLSALLCCAIVLPSLGACGTGPTTPGGGASPTVAGMGGKVAESKLQREVAPAIPASDLELLVDGNTAFALDLYRRLRGEGENLFCSPYSISVALAMTYAGARTETEVQMAETLQFSLAQERLHPAFNGLDQALASRGHSAAGKDGEGFRLKVVNALWAEQTYGFLAAFLDTLARNYGAGLRLVDFVKAPEPARIAINDWVSDQTEGRVKDLIPGGVIDSLTRLVLTNAIYFNAAWAMPFEERKTADGPFYRLDGTEVSVPLMHLSESLAYAEGDDFQAVELPYDGRELSMVVLLPAEGELDAFESALDSVTLEGILNDLAPRQVALALPRFEFESQFSLVEVLESLGMPAAFSPSADFSGMDGSRELFIGEVMHKAFVSVDEAGTEAAAATAVIMQLKAAPMEPVEVAVDRPFMFLIRDVETGTILFVGRVLDPTA